MIELLLAASPMVWVVILGTLAGLIVTIERLWSVQRGDIDADRVLLDVLEQLRDGRSHEAVAVCEREPVPVTMVLRAGLKRYELLGQAQGRPPAAPAAPAPSLAPMPLGDAAAADVMAAMQSAEEAERARLESGTRILGTLALALPLLGTGGTLLELVQLLPVAAARGNALTLANVMGLLAPVPLAAGLSFIGAAIAYLGQRLVLARILGIEREMQRAQRDLIGQLRRLRAG
jgi:biopolymer transport protein ExbB/TolQ